MTRVLAMILALLPGVALAHDAPSGWHYPAACCSGDNERGDCRPIACSRVRDSGDGFEIKNEPPVVIGYAYRHESPDEQCHACWTPSPGAKTIIGHCIFLPNSAARR